MKQALGICIWLGMVAAVWVAAPLVASLWNAHARPHYVSRGVLVEFTARVQRWRVYRFNFAYLNMDCGGEGTLPVTVLDLPEFDETPREVLAREFPDCTNIRSRSLNFPYGNIPLLDWPD